MPKAAIFFAFILLSGTFTHSYGFTDGDLVNDNFVQKKNDTFFNSGIIDISPNFFENNNYKRYIVFGSGINDSDLLQKNSIYGLQSEHGFFNLAVL